MAPEAHTAVTLPQMCTVAELYAKHPQPICIINQHFNPKYIHDLKGFVPHGSAEMSGDVDV